MVYNIKLKIQLLDFIKTIKYFHDFESLNISKLCALNVLIIMFLETQKEFFFNINCIEHV